jgi:hypothetical protein
MHLPAAARACAALLLALAAIFARCDSATAPPNGTLTVYHYGAAWNSAQRRCNKAGAKLATAGSELRLQGIRASLAANNWTSSSKNSSSCRVFWLGYFSPKGGSASCTTSLKAFRPVDGTNEPPKAEMCTVDHSCGPCLALQWCADNGELCLRRMPCATTLQYLCYREGEYREHTRSLLMPSAPC